MIPGSSDADARDRGQEQERQANLLRALAESVHAFAEATTDIARLLKLVAQRFSDLVGDGCYIRLLASDGISLEPVATYHPDPDVERFLRETTDGIRLRVGEGISGRVVQTGEPVLISNVPFDEYRKSTTRSRARAVQRIR